jgi:acetyl esterase
MSRVVSKNLFNFALTGELDNDVAAMVKKREEMKKSNEGLEFQTKMDKLKLLDDDIDVDRLLEFARQLRTQMGNYDTLSKHETLQKAMQQIEESEIKVPTNHDGKYDVLVHVYTPKSLEKDTPHAAYIYAHGGGAVACAASDFKPFLAHLAVNCEVVVFNVEYRLAPETKCPNNVKDFYEVIKYVSENSSKLEVNENKIAIGGDSGGGYICLGAEVLLAQNDETGLVKLAIPGVPMVDDYSFSDPAAMTIEERQNALTMRKIWKMIASDMKTQKDDPLLFPGKSSDEILEKFPPTIINEVEFDMFITEATRLASRLRRVGRLLEFIIIPGATHGATMMPDNKCTKLLDEALKLAFKEYLHN